MQSLYSKFKLWINEIKLQIILSRILVAHIQKHENEGKILETRESTYQRKAGKS